MTLLFFSLLFVLLPLRAIAWSMHRDPRLTTFGMSRLPDSSSRIVDKGRHLNMSIIVYPHPHFHLQAKKSKLWLALYLYANSFTL